MGKVFKAVGIGLFDLLTEIATTLILVIIIMESSYPWGTDYFFLGGVGLAAVIRTVIKIQVTAFLSTKLFGYSQNGRGLKIYYYLSGVLSVFVNPFAMMVGFMSTTTSEEYLFQFLGGFLYAWWLPNLVLLLGYLLWDNFGVLKSWFVKRWNELKR